MPERAGPSIDAVRARQAQLARRHDAITDADRVLADVLTTAHAAMRESLGRLEAIGEDIENAVANQADLALDTPSGAREFQRFLLAKHREISAVLAEARELGREKRTVLDGLRTQYGQ
ncbi:DUF4226 domain-containing protein [Mycobacterium sp. Marseille-P9652]|uniref:DUF4226 domain-containing protein n=1 Tax=Mycobacterium sp. Marseille-P9652 TaxID=2654950 RepID=UPI0012E8938C|nr:DUF4226 domain-containing protein [Mycobacterium sp. Marseille-P9652]